MLKKIYSTIFGSKQEANSVKHSDYSKRQIDSDLAVDQPNYKNVLRDKLKRQEINPEEYKALLDYHSNGFCVLDISEDLGLIDQLDKDIESFWLQPPSDLLGSSQSATDGKLCVMSEIVENNDDILRSPGFRLIDIQSHSEAAEKLFLQQKIHRIVKQILEQDCIAIQSLYFEYGSTQALHRDPWFVVTKPAKNLVACWVALEDIHIDAGPLSYVPGSHRLPFLFDDQDNIILHAPNVTREFRDSVYEDMKLEISNENLVTKRFTAKKGQVFIWHGALVHGGSPVLNRELTRKSLVIHFDAKKEASRKGARFSLDGVEHVKYTDQMHEYNGCYGYQSPLID